MARKTAGNSKGHSKQPKPKQNNAAESNDEPTPPTTTDASTSGTNAPPPPASAGSIVPLKFRLLFFLIPLLQMLWAAEAPLRPFSAVRDPSTGELRSGRDELIQPRILTVLTHPRDSMLFAPTAAMMLSTPRKENATLFVVALSGDAGGEDEDEERIKKARKGGWEFGNAWDVLGLEEERRFLLDVPELPDRPEAVWDAKAVADTVLRYVLEYNIDTILTFDEQGATGSQHRIAVSKGITSLIHSPRLKDEIAAFDANIDPESRPKRTVALRAYFLCTTSPFLSLGPLTPIIQHFVLAYRALRGGDDGVGIRTTTFISDVKTYLKIWKALMKFESEVTPVNLARWAIERSLWVNEWVEAP